VVVVGFAELAFVGVAEWMSEGSQGWRIGMAVAVELVPVDAVAAAAAAAAVVVVVVVGNIFASAGLGWTPSGAAVLSPAWA